MITWPIFIAFFLAVIAVFFSVKHDDSKEKEQKEAGENTMNQEVLKENSEENFDKND